GSFRARSTGVDTDGAVFLAGTPIQTAGSITIGSDHGSVLILSGILHAGGGNITVEGALTTPSQTLPGILIDGAIFEAPAGNITLHGKTAVDGDYGVVLSGGVTLSALSSTVTGEQILAPTAG